MRAGSGLVWIALACVAAPTVNAQSVGDRLDDLRLATAVRLALVADVRTRALDVDVSARDGGVEVSGAVGMGDRATVAEVARAVRGVRILGGSATTGAATLPAAEPGRPAVQIQPRPASAAVYHTVERGDTLFGLARRYDTSVNEILALNDRTSTGIQVGQRLRIR